MSSRSRWEARYATAVVISDLGVVVLPGTRYGRGDYPQLRMAPVDGLPLLHTPSVRHNI